MAPSLLCREMLGSLVNMASPAIWIKINKYSRFVAMTSLPETR